MSFLGHEPKFWYAVIGATILKLLTSRLHSPAKVLLTVIAAIFTAWVFTDPVLDWMEWEPSTYKAPTAAILALTGEGLVRFVVTLDVKKAIELWESIRR